MKRLLPALALGIAGVFAACGGKSPAAPTPQTNTQPTPAPQPPAPPVQTRFALSGGVALTAPALTSKVAGALVTLTSGPNAGQTYTADGAGNFFFTDLSGGSVGLRASAAGYQDGTTTVTLDRDVNSITIRVNPSPRQIDETLTGSVSGGDAVCAGSSLAGAPCKRHSFDVHNGGTISARVGWAGSADVDLELWRGTTLIASSTSVRSSEEVSTNQSGGSNYQIRVVYYSGAAIANYTLVVSRPN